jgi:alcohol dehydrogenase class IV
MIAKGLRDAYANPTNAEARENMAWAQYTAGHAFNSAGLGIVHSMAHTLGALFDSPHGQCNAIGLVPVERYNMVACPDKFRDIAEAMGVDTRGMPTWKAAEAGVDELEKLRTDLGITETFATLGLKEEHLEKFTPIVLQDVCTGGNPRVVTSDVVKMIFRQCMAPGANGKS